MKKALAFGSRAQILMLLVGASTQAQTIGPVVISPTSTPAGIAATVVVTAKITDTSVIGSTVNLQRLDAQGRVLAVIGEMRDDGKNGDSVANDRTFTIRFSVYEEKPGALTFRSSAGVQGSLLRINSTLLRFDVTGAFPTGVSITQPANLAFVNTSPITIAGTAGDPTATVRVNGIQATKNGNAFQTTVPLQEGNNTITAVATNSNASTSSASIQVTLDTTPPHVIVESPANGFTTTEAVLTFTGIVNDIVVGTVNSLQAQVTVKGLNAVVANRTFTAANVPLALGLNKIPVIARDQTGNSATTTIDVTRQAITQPFIKLISGNNQSGLVGSPVPLPLIVQLLNGAVPVPNTPVTFKITENDGFLQPGVGKPQTIVVNTDAQGRAQGLLTLGNRSGAGNNSVEVYSGNFQGTALFIASGNPKPAAKINVDSGNSQFGAVNQPLVLPFVAVVTDQGNNRLAGVAVTFAVKQGGGTINGLASQQTITDGDGRALAILTLGSQPGQDNNLVEATFTGNPGFPAAFSASGKTPGNPNQTSISGVVLDNSNNPIPNVTMRVYQTNQGNNNNQHLQVGTPVPTDVKGLFKILPAPVGFYKLMADGTTATQNGKLYPTLEYDLVTVAGQDNTVGSPIYLPELDPLAKVCVNATTGGVLKVSTSPGFSLTILPGAATFPGGSKTGCVSVTPVNPDKVPMVPGFGQQPRYVVTIQPVGTMFNPPAAITIPNMDGLSPNAKTEMYSYDHDLAAFVAIGSATVSPDGSIIASDPGVGVLKAGWHCGGDPSVPGSGQPVKVRITSPTPPPAAVAKDKTMVVVSAGEPMPGEYQWTMADATIAKIEGSAKNASVTIKGLKLGKTTLTVRFTCDSTDANGVHPFAEASIEVVVPKIESITIEAIDSALNANPNTGGGRRIYPDKQTPTDATNRKKVRIVAKIDPPVKDVRVFFKSFDVDDPSDNAAPVDANADAGDDNRGAPKVGTLSAPSGTTDAAGVVKVEFEVTLQPGDNFKIAAAVDQPYLNGLTVDKLALKDAAGIVLPTDNAKGTELLTVWRRLHVEVDSMATPPVPPSGQANTIARIVKSIDGNGTVATKITTTVNIPAKSDTDGDGTDDTDDNSVVLAGGKGRFENGSVRVGAAPGTTTASLDGNGADFIQKTAGITIPFNASKVPLAPVTGNVIELTGTVFNLKVTGGALVAGLVGGGITVGGANMTISAVDVVNSTVTVAALVDIPLQIHDDDDDTVLPHNPSTTYMSDSDTALDNVYAAAYIRPVYDGGGNVANNNQTVPFIRNTESSKVYNWASGVNNANDFWVAYVIGAFQDSYNKHLADKDPNTEGGTGGSTDGAKGGSLMYMETIRERGATAAGGAAALERRVVAHEVGHALHLDHGDGVDAPNTNGVMNTSLEDGPTGASFKFITRHLSELRGMAKPKNP